MHLKMLNRKRDTENSNIFTKKLHLTVNNFTYIHNPQLNLPANASVEY